MKINEIDFEEILIRNSYFITDGGYSKEELSELIEETDSIINNKKEDAKKRALAYVWKFQLLLFCKKLALELIEHALELSPEMPEAIVRMGIYYYRKDNNVEKMLEFVNQVIEKSPEYATAWLLRSRIFNHHFSKDNFKLKQAILDCEEFIKLKPDCSYGYEDYGHILKKIYMFNKSQTTNENIKKYLDKAIFCYSEALRLEPSNYNNYDNRCVLYMYRDEFSGDKQDHQRALSDLLTYFKHLQEDNPNIIYDSNFKNIFHDIDSSLTIKYCSEIMKLVSKKDNLYWLAFDLLAESMSQQNYHKEAITAYTKMINQAPTGSIFQLVALNGRATVYREIEKYNKALDDYTKMIDGSKVLMKKYYTNVSDIDNYLPSDILLENIYWHRALIYGNYMKDYDNEKKDIQNKKNAIKEYSKAIKLTNSYVLLDNFYSERANLYYEINNINKAIEDYTTAIEICQKENDAFHLTSNYKERMKLYLQINEKEKAFEDYIKILEIEDTPRKSRFKEVNEREVI